MVIVSSGPLAMTFMQWTASSKCSESRPKSFIPPFPLTFPSWDCAFSFPFHHSLVMGGARGQLSRILDYYTRDRSTPRLDSFWGGKDDITSATGWEKDKKTTLIFRRRVRSSDGADHSLDSGEMHVIWARGQEQGDYVHKPKSGTRRPWKWILHNFSLSNIFESIKIVFLVGLEADGHTPSIPSFYAPDEIKYHGHGKVLTLIQYNSDTPYNNRS